jgi:hypothetical protein
MLFTFPYLLIACSAHRISKTVQTIRQERMQVQHQPRTEAHLPERLVVGKAGEVPDEHRAVGVAGGLGVPERII